jgi:hypothetical protein
MIITIQILSKQKIHDVTIYAAFCRMDNKHTKKPAYHWRVITEQMFCDCFASGYFIKDPHATAENVLYHNSTEFF